jgi:excisionase family DNA binding protein
MPVLSLREAAEQAGTSKSTIWRAIKSGRMSAGRDADGGFAIDPAELFRAFQPPPIAGQDTTASTTPETGGLTVKLAALDAELKGLRVLLAEIRMSRDELRQDRDQWRGRAERFLTDQRRPWWRRLAG